MQSAEEKKETEKAAAAASRFAYSQLTEEDQAVKAPSTKRGKDGHLMLGSTDDFWSNPTGSMKSTRSKCGPFVPKRNRFGSCVGQRQHHVSPPEESEKCWQLLR